MTLMIGIDPGTGSSSPTGFVGILQPVNQLLWRQEVTSQFESTYWRIKDIADEIGGFLLQLETSLSADTNVIIAIESFVMKGKGGETLQRLIGAIIAAVPYSFRIHEVANTTVKALVGSSGRASKLEVAKGVQQWFTQQPSLVTELQTLIDTQAWDQLDACAIAIAGYLRLKKQGAVKEVT